jgi:DNA-binding NtrC family response regulator
MILEETDEIRPEHLPGEIRDGHDRRMLDGAASLLPPDGIRLEDVERDLIRQAMERTAGNVTRAARLLGVSRDTLRYRLEKHAMARAK